MPAGFCSWSTKIPPLALIPTGQSNSAHARGFAVKGGSAQPLQHCSSWLSSHVVNQIKELVWLRTILPEGKRKRLVFSQLVPTTGSPGGSRASCRAGADLHQVQPGREMGCKSQVPPGAQELHFRSNLSPPASAPSAATAVLV